MTQRVRVEFRRGKRIIRAFGRVLTRRGGFRNDAMGSMLRQWAKRYEVFTRRRWAKQGDGRWPALAPGTIKARRGSGKGAKILRDTGALFGATAIGSGGNVAKEGKGCSVDYGFSGTSHDGGVTMAELAEIHHHGKGNVPARPILVQPDRKTIRGMRNDLKRALRRVGRI